MTDTTNKPTEEFSKVVIDFVNDIKVSFPEVTPLIDRWFKGDSEFDYIDEIEERNKAILENRKTTVEFLFTFCQKKFPPRFLDILYQNPEMFDDDSVLDTEFLPHIHFKTLWKLDITSKTRETIWKYLQLILFSIIGTVENREAFGDSAKLFDNINEDDFKEKLQEALSKMQNLFEEKNETEEDPASSSSSSSSSSKPNIPNADDIHEHLNQMLDGKIGKLAKEIAEETAAELNLDGENISDMQDVFGQLMKNPTKLMSLVKNVGTKLDSRIKSGELKESELIAEASDIMNNMKNMPGMDNIQSMLSKMGMPGLGGKGAKMNMGAMEAQMERQMKAAQMRERMKSKVGAKTAPVPPSQTTSSALTEEQLVQVFSTGEKVERTPKGQQPIQTVAPSSNKKKKGKKK
jgi:hypothetical protein